MSSIRNVNKVILVGNLGVKPELRKTVKGNAVSNLAIATNRRVKLESGEFSDVTEWHKAVVWGKRAETCAKYLDKGNSVYVEGNLQTNTWKDKDGIDHWRSEIVVEDIKFLSSLSGNSNTLSVQTD